MATKKPYINHVPKISYHILSDDGTFPNSKLPLLVYAQAIQLPEGEHPEILEQVFEQNNWSNSWRDGIFDYHHYHSNTHEVVGVYSGHCTVQMGGDNGISVTLKAGDVIIIPAGVAHKNMGSSTDFKVVGAYPGGHAYDINFGKPGERPGTDQNIQQVPMPDGDPVYGSQGLMLSYWKEAMGQPH